MQPDLNATPAAAASLLEQLDLAVVTRIEAGLEGSWTASAAIVWTPEEGARYVDLRHPELRPVVEVCLPDGWVGMHCFLREDGMNVLDAARVAELVRRVEAVRSG